MTEAAQEPDVSAAPPMGPLLDRAQVPWLAPIRERLGALQDQGRLPHGLLLAGSPGAGQPEIAAWLGARLLCRSPAAGGACGKCADCRLLLAGSHPDFRWVGVLPDKKEISIDQVRALSQSLAMRSYRGGAKVSILAPAEAMNSKAFNALLKTLEEPAPETYLLLAAGRIDRMPRTVASRCMRVRLPLPGEREALDWLAARSAGEAWPALLELAGGAPFLAADHAQEGLGALDAEMRSAIAAAIDGRLDVVAFAEACARNAPAARIAWLESWLTRSLKAAAARSDPVNNNRLPWLQAPAVDRKIRAGYRLLDQLRDARRQVGGSLNAQLLFEGLAVSLAGLLGTPARRFGGASG
jgi:DNA polymerase III subunit delta'